METMESDQNSTIWKLIQITIRLMEQVEENNYYHTLSLEEEIRKLRKEISLLRDQSRAREITREDVPENF